VNYEASPYLLAFIVCLVVDWFALVVLFALELLHSAWRTLCRATLLHSVQRSWRCAADDPNQHSDSHRDGNPFSFALPYGWDQALSTNDYPDSDTLHSIVTPFGPGVDADCISNSNPGRTRTD
jgi:hypothetical protein